MMHSVIWCTHAITLYTCTYMYCMALENIAVYITMSNYIYYVDSSYSNITMDISALFTML